MISLSSARTFFGVISRQSMFMKHCLSNVNHQLAFFHSSRIWDSHKIEIKMPSLSPTMTEGTIVKWLKKEGDTIEPGDVLCEIQTDKAVVGLETEEEGVLNKIIIPEDTKNVQLGEIIAVIMAEGEAIQSSPTPAKIGEVDKPKEDITKIDPDRLIGPSVKKLLEEYDIKLSNVPSSGPHHNLLKGDVLQYIKEHNLKQSVNVIDKPKTKKPASPKAQPKGTHIDIPVTTLEASIAQQLIQSKRTIPHGYMSTDCKIDKVFDYKNKFIKDGTDVSLNEFIIKSAITALKRVPKMKTTRHNGQLKTAETINISITNFNDDKCETSVIQNAESLNIQLISEQIKASQTKESTSASACDAFRISNLSTSGISEFSEVISPTDVAIMAVGGVQHVFEEGKPVKKLRVTLSFDNYIIGENEAGEFLETFKQCLENPLNSI